MGKNNSMLNGKLSIIYIIIISDKRKWDRIKAYINKMKKYLDFSVGQLCL